MNYGEAVAVRERSNQKFEFPVHWGIDLQSEHERHLTEKYAKKPVIVVNYPKAIKAFYMRVNDDCRTVAAMVGVGDRRDVERTLAYVTGLANFRDAIPFPRTPSNARY